METELQRICPICEGRTDQTVCPHDGCITVELHAFMDDEEDTLIGRVFDNRYRILDFLGKGGMSQVYKATQLSMNRTVALKLLDKELSRDKEHVKRFFREAMAASSLQHPNTIKLHDFGRAHEGFLFIAMEFLSGEPLNYVIYEQGPLPWKRAVRIGVQALKSLAEAHSHGIVHRDLKPDNIFIEQIYGEKDFVKILDFGIAKLVSGEGHDMSLTKAGMILGTPTYMSPEQARGADIDHRSDLYAFGVILYEMLTTTVPFDADSPVGILMRHIKDPPPSIRTRPLASPIPAGLEHLIYKSLNKQADDRYQSAEEMIDALERLLMAERMELVPPPAHISQEVGALGSYKPTNPDVEPPRITGEATVGPVIGTPTPAGPTVPDLKPGIDHSPEPPPEPRKALTNQRHLATRIVRRRPSTFRHSIKLYLKRRNLLIATIGVLTVVLTVIFAAVVERHLDAPRLARLAHPGAALSSRGFSVTITIPTPEPPTPTPDVPAPPVPPPDPPPTKVEEAVVREVSIKSIPSGAAVFLGTARIGTTPFVWTVPPSLGTDEVAITLKLPGYYRRKLTVGSQDESLSVKLYKIKKIKKQPPKFEKFE